MSDNDLQTSEQETQPTEQVTPQADPEPETPQTPPVEPEQPQPDKPQVDYEQKFKQSSREAQLLLEKNKKLEEENRTLRTQVTPTDAELQKAYPDANLSDPFTKRVLTNQLALEKEQAAIKARLLEDEAEKKWQADLRQLVADPKYKKLKDDPGFERFVMKPTHKGLDIRILANAYLFEGGEDEVEPPKPVPKTPGLENGSGGPRSAPKPKKISLEEAAQIRKTDYKRYMELVRTHQIDDEV